MRVKTLLAVFASFLLLAGCESTSEGSGSASGSGAQSANAASGAGGAGSRISNNDVLFDTDKSDLRPQARATIESWAGWMRGNPSSTVTIEGHADERGTREYNLALGDRRAQAAKNYLVALGVSPNRVRTISYGKERPAADGHSEQAWAQNRRSALAQN